MIHYLIEFRFHGKAKYEMKNLIWDITRRFHLRTKRAIPHITLAGPFYTNNEQKLIKDFNEICSQSPIMSFEVNGFSSFEDSKVVYLDVNPSAELENFRWNLSQKINSYCNLTPYDKERKFEFHSTIAMKLRDDHFHRIKEYIQNKPKVHFKHVVVRVTLLKGGFILREYDFFLRKSLFRSYAKSKQIYAQTIDLLKAHFEKRFNPNDFIGESIRLPKKSVASKIKGIFEAQKIFFISDLHFDHANIIKYCKRPFLNVEEMNSTLINNWNNIVGKKDVVYVLGDVSFGRGHRPIDYWFSRLNGKIYLIRGNHDTDKVTTAEELEGNYSFEYKGHQFLLMHDPNRPTDYGGWIIHGDKHNNDVENYPFINKKSKMINVSVELIKYKPVAIQEILEKIMD